MEKTCSFLSIVGGQCGPDRRDRNKCDKCITLRNCQRDIAGHKATYGFSDVDDEVDLILSRASIFSPPVNIDQLIICPAHRATLGIGWTRRVADKCKLPSILSQHSDEAGKRPKAERGLSKAGSQLVLKECVIFLAVGSGIPISLKIQCVYKLNNYNTAVTDICLTLCFPDQETIVHPH